MQDNNAHKALGNLTALVDFSRLINSSLDLNFALNNLLLTCFGKFHTTRGMIILVNQNTNQLEIKSSKGFSNIALEEFPELTADNFRDNKNFIDFLIKNKIQINKDIITSDGFRGMLLLGEKLLKKEYTENDTEFVETLINIGASAIENSLTVEKLKNVNKTLDAKVNQLSTLFDLSKEFSGILKTETVVKLLVFSIIGQMMISKYGLVLLEDNGHTILDTKINRVEFNNALNKSELKEITTTLTSEQIKEHHSDLYELGIEIAVPMQISGETKGLIFLGKRITAQKYTKSDIDYLYSIGSLAIISIENSHLFEEAIEKQKMEKDLELARNIQQNLLPKSLPKSDLFEIVSFNKSAKQVGGDYYDVIELNKRNTLFAIADVSGKGVQAALLVANLQAFIKSICKQEIEIDEATNLINDLLSENTIMGSFITFFWGILNKETFEFTFVNAGHNPPLLIRNGEITKLTKGGMILGVMETMIPYLSDSVTLQKGDMLVMFTDGVTEAMDSNGEEYTDERLEELSIECAKSTARESMDTLIDDVKEFTSGAEQSDDITLLILKIK